jgi:hypothetical protein
MSLVFSLGCLAPRRCCLWVGFQAQTSGRSADDFNLVGVVHPWCIWGVQARRQVTLVLMLSAGGRRTMHCRADPFSLVRLRAGVLPCRLMSRGPRLAGRRGTVGDSQESCSWEQPVRCTSPAGIGALGLYNMPYGDRP